MFLRGGGCYASYVFIRSAHHDLVDISPGMRFYFKFQVIKEILGKDVNSKCDIKYELANVSAIKFK